MQSSECKAYLYVMFKIFDFPYIEDEPFKKCLGVLGYLMFLRRDEKDYTFVPSKFIRPISLKSGVDLIGYLIRNNYILKVELEETDEEKMYKAYNYAKGKGYKKKANIYYLNPNILSLAVIEINDSSIEKTIKTNLHHLYGYSFNHWVHNYQHISIHVPDDNTWEEVIGDSYYYHNIVEPSRHPIDYHIHNLKAWAMNYGYMSVWSYENTITGSENYDKKSPGIENSWGRASNIFTVCDPVLRNYTSLENAVEVGIKFSEGVIIADQLLKGFGMNDFTAFFIDRSAAYQEKLKEVERENKRRKKRGDKLKNLPDPLTKSLLPEDEYYKDINQYFIEREREIIRVSEEINQGLRNRRLFVLQDDDEREQLEFIMQGMPESLEQYVPSEEDMRALESRFQGEKTFYRNEIGKALFGYKHNWFFNTHFPGSWSDLLYHIKAANGDCFLRFVGEIKPGAKLAFLIDDKRIRVKDDDGNYLDPIAGPEIYRRGQKYYKAMSLVRTLRENEVMRKIWNRLKRCGILCIPINDKVLVSGSDLEAVKHITLEIWREHLDRKIKIFPEVIKRC